MLRYIPLLFIIAILGAGCVTAIPNQTNGTQEQPTTETKLDLSGRGLRAIPSSVFSQTELEQLDLSNNQLTGAPQSQIQQLINLKSLDLSDNDLTGLPAELGQLKKLESLDVSNNKLTGLPMEIGELTQLRTFNISGNQYSTRDLNEISSKLINTEIIR